MSSTPDMYQKVEILVDGKWVPATFYPADHAWEDDDEVWWLDHFLLDDGNTVPEDTQSGDALPQWRAYTEADGDPR